MVLWAVKKFRDQSPPGQVRQLREPNILGITQSHVSIMDHNCPIKGIISGQYCSLSRFSGIEPSNKFKMNDICDEK
jgi:hypothetical protein